MWYLGHAWWCRFSWWVSSGNTQSSSALSRNNALINVNSQGPPWATQGILTRRFDPHRGIWQPNTDPLKEYLTKTFKPRGILTPIWKNCCIFLAFFIYFLSIPTQSSRDFLTGYPLLNSLNCLILRIKFCFKELFYFLNFQHGLVYYTHPGAFWHNNLYTPKGRNTFMTRNFWPIEGTLTTHFLKF